MAERADGIANPGFVLERPGSVQLIPAPRVPVICPASAGWLQSAASLAIVLRAAPPVNGKEAEDQENGDTYKDQTKVRRP